MCTNENITVEYVCKLGIILKVQLDYLLYVKLFLCFILRESSLVMHIRSYRLLRHTTLVLLRCHQCCQICRSAAVVT